MTIPAPTARSTPPPFAAPEAGGGPSFGQRLREYRHAAGLTQGELATHARVSERTILALEAGTGGVPQRGTLARLAAALDVGGAARAAFLALAAARTPVGGTRHNLPAARTAFIGRAGSQHAITRLLTGGTRRRLVTLIGPGGVGKTRLALQVANTLRPTFPGDIWFIDLVETAGGTSVTDTLAATIGVRDRPGLPGVEALIAELRDRRCLLILDNCEHLRAPVAALAKLLLDRTGGVQLLATSREALGLAGEVVRRVAPLSLPATGGESTPVELAQSEAAQLFCARAVQADPDFAVTPANAATIATLCTRLDGLPLLLELVAAQLSTQSLTTLAVDVTAALHSRQVSRRGGAARQRNVQALLDWSHALLTPDGQTLLRRLAPFAAGWTRDAMRAVCGGPDLPDTDTTLDRLVAQSLVVEERAGDPVSRYRLLETIRHQAQARLVAAGEADWVAQRLCAWCIALAESCPYPLDGGPAGNAWLERLAPEVGNVRAAYLWADAHAPAWGLRLATACWPYGFMRMNHLGARGRLDQFLARGVGDDHLRARTLYGRGVVSLFNDLGMARADLATALALAEAAGDTALATAIRWPLAFAALSLGASDETARLLDEGWAVVGASPHPGRRAPYRMMRGYLALARGDRDDGEAELRQADADAQAAAQPLFRCMILGRLVQAELLRGDPDGARATCATLLTVAESIGSALYRFVGYHRLGMAEEWAGEFDAADRAYAEARRFSATNGGDSLERASGFLWRARHASYQEQPIFALAALDEADAVLAEFAHAPLRRESAVLRGMALWRCARFAEARAQLTRVVPLIATGDPAFRARCLEGFVSLASGAGEPAAARWQAAATALRDRAGMPQPRADARRTARTEADLRALLPPDALAAARDPATAPTVEDALAEIAAWLATSRESWVVSGVAAACS